VLEFKVLDGEDDEVVLQFEHSLLSLSKWEARTKRPFLSPRPMTPMELIDYFGDMLVSPDVDPALVYALKPQHMEALSDYIKDTRTASSVPSSGKPPHNPETITSELIYYWLTALKIPYRPVETWHLNRLMMLVQITNFKNTPPKKRSEKEIMTDWAAQNKRQKEILGIKD
jgi:hypothetical protein